MGYCESEYNTFFCRLVQDYFNHLKLGRKKFLFLFKKEKMILILALSTYEFLQIRFSITLSASFQKYPV